MYRYDTSYGRHQCSCRRKRLNEMHENRTKRCKKETKSTTYSDCKGYVGKPTYPVCTTQTGKPTYSHCTKHKEKHSCSKPLIVEETFTNPACHQPTHHGYNGCGCTHCHNKHRTKRYICHCYECN